MIYAAQVKPLVFFASFKFLDHFTNLGDTLINLIKI